MQYDCPQANFKPRLRVSLAKAHRRVVKDSRVALKRFCEVKLLVNVGQVSKDKES